jgi:predicted nucleic-acid-binding Zn-ribbon protein
MEIFCVECGTTIHTEKKCPKCGSKNYEAISK